MAARLRVVPETMSRTAWVSSVPIPLTPKSGFDAANLALQDARKIYLYVWDHWRGKTVPPPPWPAHPELVRARKKVRVIRDVLKVIHNKAPNAKLKPAVRKALVREGSELYRQSKELVRRLEQNTIKPEDLVPTLAGAVPWWVWAGAAYYFLRPKRSRRP